LRRLYPDQPVAGVGALIICKGKILLEKRLNEPGKGKWSIPGGVVELGENTEQTVIREVKEETGLEVEKPELIDVIGQVSLDENDKVKYHFIIIDYLVKLKGGTLKAASDAAELRWVGLDEIENRDLTITFKTFYRRNRDRFRGLESC
jgi:8-oxo-dGTP diphosphatase